MKGMTAFACISDIDLDLIEESVVLLERGTPYGSITAPRRGRESALSRFFGSGWGVAMICAVVVAKCIGCSLPILAKLVKLDPALMAGPMITAIVDALSLAIYLTLAKTFLM